MEVRPISHHPGYFVSSDGQVFSEKYGRRIELKQSEHKGYRRVALSEANKRQIYPAHRLVAEAFIPNPESKPFVNHRDGNKRNNVVQNLEWCTASENQAHSVAMGRNGSGAANGHYGYRYRKLFPSEELRNQLVELGIPRPKHNLAELGEMLPEVVETDWQYDLRIEREDDLWRVLYIRGRQGLTAYHNEAFADSEADARAKMLVYLLENNLVTVDQINQSPTK
jgi:hypothetical protein